jgi:hypothetical protein
MTSHSTGPSRRTVLAGGLAISGAALLGPAGRAQAANPVDRRWTNARSQNGWPVLDSFTSVPIEGSALSVPLAGGAAATILTHVARRYHYEVHALHRGDLAGGTSSRTIRASEQSNYLSGTAISVLPGHYPIGQHGNLFPKELVVIEDMITECDGVVKWGGDLKTPMEGISKSTCRRPTPGSGSSPNASATSTPSTAPAAPGPSTLPTRPDARRHASSGNVRDDERPAPVRGRRWHSARRRLGLRVL